MPDTPEAPGVPGDAAALRAENARLRELVGRLRALVEDKDAKIAELEDAGQMPSLTGFFGVTLIMNLTTSTYTYNYTPRGTTNVGGSEAEWIMERPTVNNSLAELANYGSARMSNAYARRVAGGYVGYQGATNEQITMFNNTDILSTVSAIDSTTMQFNWHAFH